MVSEQIEVGRNAKKCFTQIDEDREMEDGIGMKMNQPDPVVVQQPTNKRVRGKTEVAVEVIDEHYKLIAAAGGGE